MTRKVRSLRDTVSSYESEETRAHNFAIGASVNDARSAFDSRATIFRWTCTSGAKLLLQFWHAKTPMFTYPREWFPWPIEFALGFPRCPYGGVSIGVWSNCCALVIALVGELVSYMASSFGTKTKQPQKVPVEAKSK
jgi:hypothetical protein